MDRIEVTWNKYYKDSAFVRMCVSSITEKDIITFFNTVIVENGAISQKEFERLYQIIHAVLLFLRDMEYSGIRLYDWEVIKRNVPRNKILSEKKIESALSSSIVSRMVKAVVQDNIYPVKRSACLCLCLNFYLGLRVGELAALQFSDFDIDRKVVKIIHSDSKRYERNADGDRLSMTYVTSDTKTAESHREIPLLPEAVYLYENIKNYHKACGYNSSFLVYDGADTIRVRSLDRTLRKLCKLCNISPFGTHCIRKTFASMLHYNNVPSRVIADLMGHADISTTERSYILSFNDNYSMYYNYMKTGLNYN